uniref:PH domain-containing protein n=1 Tax=Noctiluca scintillans TaxID=2966 RepID=A0A7S1B033_NOCSC|mmetsp:Transcript_7393/g.20256  ORF Transcript_7393/g.20256 Transcript_7393/m.20256 type:complete len:510 (+) Transcript_7393:184-1713(+)|eukprot:CAMPEP_0194481474 /NCGR_PEP_ID=MMETSP0253-20130528/3879_1 /TAXON_ID=2966 /ORGANISM="Noctiluca scintillans" /LENGTH=509 /DNA_ID=CAMNT_0039320961 /DNA_START=180 /DNA_END=1709 /DNA_ORIENTATION=+
MSAIYKEKASDLEFEQYREIRRHARRMQAGTPLLLQSVINSKEELQICTFWISQDLQQLRWTVQDADGEVHEVPVSNIVEVLEDKSDVPEMGFARGQADEQHSLTVVLRDSQGTSAMGLICATPEDMTTWREGLRFIVGAQQLRRPSPEPVPVPVSVATTRSPRVTRAKAPAFPARPATARRAQVTDDLSQRLSLQEETIGKLKQENTMLQEMMKRKDLTLAQLLRDSQTRSTERCNKTESTSRESDDHLRDREVTILRRKNARLKKTLKTKQQTIAQLLELLGKALKQQGVESSAFEEEDEKDDDDDDSDVLPPKIVETVKVPRRENKQQKKVVVSVPRQPVEQEPAESEASSEDIEQIAKKLERLERDVAGMHGDPVSLPASSSAPSSARAAESPSQARNACSAVPVRTAPNLSSNALSNLLDGMSPSLRSWSQGEGAVAVPPVPSSAGFDFSAVGGGPPGVRKSTASLQKLAEDMALLEEKKRRVEQLAKSLEPPSEDEDDGFPLR